MSIPGHRLSTTVQEGAWLDPDNLSREVAYWDYERGPIALNDPSAGLDYQNWTMKWNPVDGWFTVTPETVGTPTQLINVAAVAQASFCFDQNGHASITYVANGQAYLYWFDTDVSNWVTTPLDASVVSTMLSLDDKRTTQTQSSDMILWYTREMTPGLYDLFTREQRDRFEVEYPMTTDIPPFVVKAGMNDVLRGQVSLRYGL